jgi:hypothetical protein
MKTKSNNSTSKITNSESNDEYYIIEKILKSRIVNGRKEFRIKWLGYTNDWNTWEPEENVRTEIIESSDDDETKNSQSSNKRKSVRKRKHLEKESKPIVNSTSSSSSKTPIILNHKISKKKLEAILEKHRLLKKQQSNAISDLCMSTDVCNTLVN